MRSADAIPPTGHPVGRTTNGRSARRWATLLLLIVLALAALPQPTPAVAQPDPAETMIATMLADATGLPSDSAVASDEPTAGGQVATSAPTQPVQDGPLTDLPIPSPPAHAPVELPVGSTAPEPVLADPSLVDDLATTQTPEDRPVVTAADTTLPVVCQLVIRATALTPPPGTGIGDPLPDPVAGATFVVSVPGGSITLLTNSTGVLNLFPESLGVGGLAVATGDTVTVTQVATRAGLTLGEPVFTMTFAWLSTVSGGCRVEAFVVNPIAAAPPSATTPASDASSASPSNAPSLAPSLNPSPSPPPSPSPSPSPSPPPSPPATATQPVVTATTVPTATAAPTIPVNFGQIDVIVVARPSAGASPGAPQMRLAGARLTIVNRTGRILTATMTTGSDGLARSPLLAIGSYDLILDSPPVGYFGAQAQGFDVASPTLQHFVFQLEVNNAPTASPSASVRASPTAIPGTATATVRPSNTPRVSPMARATLTTLAGTATATGTTQAMTATTESATATATVQAATATIRPSTGTTTATAIVQSTGTASAATATQRPARATSTPRETAGAATATTRPATATAMVSATATTRPPTAATTATPIATIQPTTSVATATNALPTAPVVTGTPPRPTRSPATGPAATATRTPTPRPAGMVAATPNSSATATKTPVVSTSTTTSGAGASGRPLRPSATVLGTATQVTQIEDASITVYVSICIDPRLIDFGEFGSETDLGPRYLTDIDRSRCRPARSGETRITLTSTYPNYLPAYAQTNGTDANGRLSFVFPAAREQRIGNLHLEGPIPAQDAGVKINPGRVLVIPLTLVILDPAIQATALETTAGSGPPITGDPLGWLPGTLAIIGFPMVLMAIRQSGHRAR